MKTSHKQEKNQQPPINEKDELATQVDIKLISIECKHKTYCCVVKLQTGRTYNWGAPIEYAKSDTHQGHNKIHTYDPPTLASLNVQTNRGVGIKLVVHEMHHLLHFTSAMGEAVITDLHNLTPNEEHFMRLPSNLGFFFINVVVKVKYHVINPNDLTNAGVNLDHFRIKQLEDQIAYIKQQHAQEISQIHSHYHYILEQNHVVDPSTSPRGKHSNKNSPRSHHQEWDHVSDPNTASPRGERKSSPRSEHPAHNNMVDGKRRNSQNEAPKLPERPGSGGQKQKHFGVKKTPGDTHVHGNELHDGGSTNPFLQQQGPNPYEGNPEGFNQGSLVDYTKTTNKPLSEVMAENLPQEINPNQQQSQNYEHEGQMGKAM